jgi:ribose transport system substrate-binding protein
MDDQWSKQMQQLSRRMPAMVAAGLCTLALVACSNNDPTSPAAGPQSASAVSAEVQANADKLLTVPTSISQTVSLTKTPPKGKKVAFVQCADPVCAKLTDYMKDAAGALGWSVVTVNATATDPGAAIQQAIDAKVDYIATTGFPVALFKNQMAAAKAKGIGMFLCFSTDVPAGADNNLYSDCYDSTAANAYATGLTDYMIAQSKGAANALVVSIPTYPILTAQVDAVRAELTKNCPGCKMNTLEVTVNDLVGGTVAQSVSSYLQAHPDVNYIYFTYASLNNGVAAALRSAGLLSKVKIIGTQGLQPQMKEVANGTSAAWSALPEELAVWTMVDQMARQSVGEWSTADERKSAVPPYYLVTTPKAANDVVNLDFGWPGPTGFKDTFKKLWGV